MSYFTAATEVIGEALVDGGSQLKVVLLEPSLLALRRTQTAIIARVELRKPAGKTTMPQLSNELGTLNESGFCRSPLPSPSRGGGSVPLHWNLWFRIFA